MSTAPNPLTGASWGTTAPSPMNPTLFNLPQAPGIGQSGGMMGNPGGYANPFGGKETDRNVMLNNIIAGQLKNQLAPQFANQMGQYAGPAGGYFQNLMNLGSPYYQQQQRATFEQGNQQNQNAAAQAKQQLNAQGYGYSPSGAEAGMIGGMAQQGAQNLTNAWLQNLFQNENLQMQGAQNLTQLASLFNPTQLLGGTSAGASPVISPTTPQSLSTVLQGIGSLFPHHG